MSAVRVTHTPCGMAVDLDATTNHVLTPDTDTEHTCPVTNGPHRVIRWGSRWSVEDALDPDAKQPRYDTEAEAQADADTRNTASTRRHTPRPVQPDLFSNQEAI